LPVEQEAHGPARDWPKLGPYVIQAQLGAGGMGEVYRARDTRLDRTVAVKVLPTHLSSDSKLRQRLDREARAISSLNHPNICHLYDVGYQDEIDYMVMEYLEGETLANRLLKGPVPLDQVLKIGAELAGALDHAHRHGIVHRDVKPGNIMLTKSGAKLMDFGLAKPATAVEAPGSDGITLSVSEPITGAGTSVGTFQYMSPEQVEGKSVTSRSDIFSLGCVVYEMITGHRAFEGKSQIAITSAILEKEPKPISSRERTAPLALDGIVQACLTKNPDERWESMHDLYLGLRWLMDRQQTSAEPTRTWRFAPWLAIAAVALLAAFVTTRLPRGAPPASIVRASLMPPTGYSFAPYNFALSPDGNRLAFVTVAQDGTPSLWVRTMSIPAAQPISGSEGAQYPFWSPDSRRVGFYANHKLKTVDLFSGEVRIVCESTAFVGGTWNTDDIIVFAPGIAQALYRVAATGGAATPVTRLPREGSGQAHRWPFFLPDGKHFLYLADWSAPEDPHGNGLYAGSLDGGEAKLISPDILGNVEYANGYLLYFRNRGIMAQPFDVNRLVLHGAATVVAEGVERHVGLSRAGFSSSPKGTLVFQSAADSAARLTWFDSSGRQTEELPGAGNRDPRLSPNGSVLAVSADEAGNGHTNIRVYDLARGVSTTLTATGEDEFPLWSPDGRIIYYSSHQGKTFSINRVAADGSSPPENWLQGPKMIPDDFTRDGRYLALMNLGLGGASVVDIYSISDRKRVQRFPGAEAEFSPDGGWIAYTAQPAELFVRAFPGPGAHIQISNGGGAQPRWSTDGTRLYYISPDRKLMMVRFDPSGKRTPGPPQVVMQTRVIASYFVFIQYDVAPDGTRFLINSLPPGGGGPLALVTNWAGELKN
jgi:eukaryotic-like serine/threonine-protein kinase